MIVVKEDFTGISGNYYIRNPHGVGDYVYAVYTPERIPIVDHLPARYCSEEDALSDLSKENMVKRIQATVTVQVAEGKKLTNTLIIDFDTKILSGPPAALLAAAPKYADYIKHMEKHFNGRYSITKKMVYVPKEP